MTNLKVSRRSKNGDDTVIGKKSNYLRTNTMVYDVEFPNAEIKEHAENPIVPSMHTQVGSDGIRH